MSMPCGCCGWSLLTPPTPSSTSDVQHQEPQFVPVWRLGSQFCCTSFRAFHSPLSSKVCRSCGSCMVWYGWQQREGGVQIMCIFMGQVVYPKSWIQLFWGKQSNLPSWSFSVVLAWSAPSESRYQTSSVMKVLVKFYWNCVCSLWEESKDLF